MKDMTIGQAARYAGIETSAIRYYESVGLLPKPRRINGRNRRYDADVLKRLGLIQLLRDAGFGIRELQILFSDIDTPAPTTTHWKPLAEEKVAELDGLIQRLVATRTWLSEAIKRDCKGIDECILINVNESGAGMKVTLLCELNATRTAAENVSDSPASIDLLTLSAPLPTNDS